MQINLELDEIVVGKRRRSLDVMFVDSLAASIKESGLINPITIDEDNNLIAGRHRLEAVRELGWKKIACHVIKGVDARHAELAEIDENLLRNELTVLERDEQITRRKEIYEQIYPKTKGGAAGGTAKSAKNRGDSTNDKMSFVENPTFTEETALKTGVSQRTIQRSIERTEAIPESVRDAIRDTPVADSASQLKALSELPEKQQAKVAGKIASGEAKTVSEALGGKPKGKTDWDDIATWTGKIMRKIDDMAAAERVSGSAQHQGVIDAMQVLANAVKAFRRKVSQ